MELNANVNLAHAKLTVAETFKVLAAKQSGGWKASRSIRAKHTNRQRENHAANVSARRDINREFSQSGKGHLSKVPVWHGAINGTPKFMSVK